MSDAVNSSRRLLIFGAGGFGREVLDLVGDVNDAGASIEVLGFVDDREADSDHADNQGLRTLSFHELPESLSCSDFVVAVGDGDVRLNLTDRVLSAGFGLATLRHPSCTVGTLVEIGEGTVLTAGVRVTTNVRIGVSAHINLNCTVGHDCSIGDFATVMPGATISGNVVLEDRVTIGTGANILPGVRIGAGAFVGAGAVVTRDVDPGVTVVGSPAKPLVKRT